ncbi:glycosyl hydrolase family 8 [Flavivirga abyssicola]|uniref:glycosyl hydrolase family 8 n=1 Tax=Flavivirga abyssicola TaxID=3063533 RepID=UPI0026DFD811|nr:glycosyl hydrolase family 8 [Flavivirga sp. MEBiC07777]WVK12137.1 glycosyl hydrolase family 8 [Flavivirga sp. MEBiC07777]
MNKRYLTFVYLLFSLISLSNAQISEVNFLNRDYDYGIQPTNIQANDVYDVYVAWRNAFATPCTNGRYRIKFDTPTETVSEGIAYGMLLAAYANDKELLDGLWLYYQDFSNANGVMNWKIDGCSSVIGQNGATDAELDAAIALIVADKRWGNSGTINYKSDAQTLISAIKNYEVEANTNVLKPGDAWGGSANTNPSYFATGYFRVFGEYTNDTTFWNDVADTCYDIINANLSKNNAAYNLVSDWCEADGDYSAIVPWAHDQGKSYFYDAARTPWRIAIDYVWYGNSKALDYSVLCNNFVTVKGGFDKIYPGYSQAGVAINTAYKDPTFTGAYATASMSSSTQSFVNNGYTELKNQSTSAYFGATLRAIYMFALSGNAYNPLKEPSLSVTEIDDISFEIYPNPTSDYLFVNFRSTRPKTLSLYSINGAKLLSKPIDNSEIKLDIRHLKTGIYLLNIDKENHKIVKL